MHTKEKAKQITEKITALEAFLKLHGFYNNTDTIIARQNKRIWTLTRKIKTSIVPIDSHIDIIAMEIEISLDIDHWTYMEIPYDRNHPGPLGVRPIWDTPPLVMTDNNLMREGNNTTYATHSVENLMERVLLNLKLIKDHPHYGVF